MKLDPRIFNDVRLKTGRILHFKRAGRDPRVTAKLDRYRSLEERHPRALAASSAPRNALQHLAIAARSARRASAATGPNFVGWKRLVCRITGRGVLVNQWCSQV